MAQPVLLNPIQANLWLLQCNYELIREIPETFDTAQHLTHYLQSAIEDWLVDLVGSSIVNDINQALIDLTTQPLSTNQQDWLTLMNPFLVYASFSTYIGKPHVILTDTGPVKKSTVDFVPINSGERSELSSFYKIEAERYAKRLAIKASQTATSCQVVVAADRVEMYSSGGNRRSRF